MKILLAITFVLCCSVAAFADSSLLTDIAAKRAAQPLETTTQPIAPPAHPLVAEVLRRRGEQLLDTTSFGGGGSGGRIPGTPFFTNLWYARTDGGTTTQCTGLVNAAYTTGTGQPCGYASLQNAVDAVVAGDSVSARAGDTWDGTLIIPNKSCTSGSPCIVKSSALASLPAGRVGPANASNMPRVRSLGGGSLGGAFQFAANADYWTIDGFEITDNAATSANISMLVDASDVTINNLTIQHCWIHQKETGTNYNRTAQRAIQFEGRSLIAKWNYIYIIGYFYPEIQGGNTHYQMDTAGLLSVGGNDLLLEDNYISTWWNNVFLGGVDADPQNTATLTSATTTSATFSNTTGLAAGVMLRLEFAQGGTLDTTGLGTSCGAGWPSTGTTSTAVFTTTSGPITTAARHFGVMTNTGDASSGIFGICSVSGSTYVVANARSLFAHAGTVTSKVYETALVTSVSGSTVNYTPIGGNYVQTNGATSASWNYGDQGLISDVVIRKNTFYVDPAFAHDVYLQNGYSPKGLYEIKNVNRLTVEGNYVLGYPTLLATYATNQYGTAPWATTKHIIIRNNWIAPDLGYPESSREAIYPVNQDDYATITQPLDIQIYNNLIKNVTSFVGLKGADNVQIYHNTVLNGAPTSFSFTATLYEFGSVPITGFVFRDNIFSYSAYGVMCFWSPNTLATCYPSATWSKNVAVNTAGVTSGDLTLEQYTLNGGVLSPINTAFSSVGFTNLAGDVYSLTPVSSYYHAGTGGTDPGVDWAALLTALGNPPPPTTAQSVIGGSATIRGGVTIQ